MFRFPFHPREILRACAITAALLATACSDSTAPATATDGPEASTSPALDAPAGAVPGDSPLLHSSAAEATAAQGRGRVIPGQYIVVFKDEVADAPGLAKQLNKTHGGHLRFTYGAPHKGFAIGNLPDQAIAALARNPHVSYIEADQVVTTDGVQSMVGGQPWGLDRIDQRSRALSRTYSYSYTGYGVHAYILDTGLDYSHPDFGGRARVDHDVFGGYGGYGNYIGYGKDCEGHGTHVAGIVGGKTYGVAKSVRLHAVKVLYGNPAKCGGVNSASAIIKGLEWVYYHRINPAVVNMSLTAGAKVNLLDAWVNTLANSGVFVAVAAGNSGQDACNASPARALNAFTTAASDWYDNRVQNSVWASNYGSCVDGYAPGDQIRSTWPGGGTFTQGGTSMASPHIAGVAALLKQGYGNQSSAWIANTIKSWATPGAIRGNPSGTPNLLLFKGGF